MVEKHPCEGCDYYGGYNRFSACCNYFLITGKRRPCPTGKECIVRSESKSKNQKKKQKNT